MATELTDAISLDLTGTFLSDRASVISAGASDEHILLETDEHEQQPERDQPYTVQRRFLLDNRVRATRSEITLFEEGRLEIDEQKGRRSRDALLLDMRYLDPQPTLSRFVATKVLYVALGLLACTALLGTLAYFSVLSAFTIPAALGTGTATVIACWLFAYRTHEKVVFRTGQGQVPVLILRANLGCLRACRALVPPIARAIAEARASNAADKSVHLRREMREHYRLREAGVLTDEACATGTQRILALFG